jgi:hypothetical protein
MLENLIKQNMSIDQFIFEIANVAVWLALAGLQPDGDCVGTIH